jgi:hypothetical protein
MISERDLRDTITASSTSGAVFTEIKRPGV